MDDLLIDEESIKFARYWFCRHRYQVFSTYLLGNTAPILQVIDLKQHPAIIKHSKPIPVFIVPVEKFLHFGLHHRHLHPYLLFYKTDDGEGHILHSYVFNK